MKFLLKLVLKKFWTLVLIMDINSVFIGGDIESLALLKWQAKEELRLAFNNIYCKKRFFETRIRRLELGEFFVGLLL